MLIRRETPADTGTVHAVTAAAFARPGSPDVAESRLLGEPLVALLGAPGYYARFGFRLAGEYGIASPAPEWHPHFQVRTLSAYTPEIRGTFACPEPFDRV